ncbi:MAG: thiamine biosynthesis protein ApbE [Flavobacteriales bacterium]|nr:MAG: thiamine biosynthesis protein ApbE [Flavobacteriales bacterium]
MNSLRIIFLKWIAPLAILLSCSESTELQRVDLNGNAFGTRFSITYFDTENRDFTIAIDSLFNGINQSLSTYIPASDISRINNGDTTVVVDYYFEEVFNKSKKIYEETNGIFDPTIGNLVNAWGFGPENYQKALDSAQVDSVLHRVGFDKVRLHKGKIFIKFPHIYFDFNAIAKGYAVDVAGRFLEQNKIEHYLVEIGGEIRSRGQQPERNAAWQVAIENPNFDGTRSIEKIINLENEAMATSGSYRKFKIDSTGRKYSHIISTITGYPVKNNLLSVSVIGQRDCADLDAYATALMAMSLTEAKTFFANNKTLKGHIIFTDDENKLATYSTPNL